jgi:hypothetical protein
MKPVRDASIEAISAVRELPDIQQVQLVDAKLNASPRLSGGKSLRHSVKSLAEKKTASPRVNQGAKQ